MKKTGRIFALFLLLFTTVQCTDDDEVEAGVHQSQEYNFVNREESSDDIDTEKDE
jgi:hypothetical protein